MLYSDISSPSVSIRLNCKLLHKLSLSRPHLLRKHLTHHRLLIRLLSLLKLLLLLLLLQLQNPLSRLLRLDHPQDIPQLFRRDRGGIKPWWDVDLAPSSGFHDSIHPLRVDPSRHAGLTWFCLDLGLLELLHLLEWRLRLRGGRHLLLLLLLLEILLLKSIHVFRPHLRWRHANLLHRWHRLIRLHAVERHRLDLLLRLYQMRLAGDRL